MALPDLKPISKMSKSILPATGSMSNVTSSTLPYGTYIDSTYWTTSQIDDFKNGAAKQVNYTYAMLGGDVLDIELSENQIYASYEDACLQYSYILNLHQARNTLSDFLGTDKAQFDEYGQIIDDPNSSVPVDANERFPRFNIGYARRVSMGISAEAGFGGDATVYSASLNVVPDQQDYDLQEILSSHPRFSAAVDGKKVIIRRVWYKTRRASWNFYAYYGGISVVGNLSTYGQYADDTTFEVVPTWQHKMQAMAYEDAIRTRISSFSYILRNNKLRLFPVPSQNSPPRFWFEFSIPSSPVEDNIVVDEDGNVTPSTVDEGLTGVSNFSNLPFQNLPYSSINAAGKDWIKRYALATSKIMLGNIRSKFSSVPIPGDSVTLNGPELINQGRQEQDELKNKLLENLEELTYNKLIAGDTEKAQAAKDVLKNVPLPFYFM